MKYAILILILLLLSTSAQGVEVTEVKQVKVCKIEKIPVNCAYLFALILREMKRCPECDWQTAKI